VSFSSALPLFWRVLSRSTQCCSRRASRVLHSTPCSTPCPLAHRFARTTTTQRQFPRPTRTRNEDDVVCFAACRGRRGRRISDKTETCRSMRRNVGCSRNRCILSSPTGMSPETNQTNGRLATGNGWRASHSRASPKSGNFGVRCQIDEGCERAVVAWLDRRFW